MAFSQGQFPSLVKIKSSSTVFSLRDIINDTWSCIDAWLELVHFTREIIRLLKGQFEVMRSCPNSLIATLRSFIHYIVCYPVRGRDHCRVRKSWHSKPSNSRRRMGLLLELCLFFQSLVFYLNYLVVYQCH